MKDIREVLKQKEADVQQVIQEIKALRMVIALIWEPTDGVAPLMPTPAPAPKINNVPPAEKRWP